jgi:methyl-accepting chemotaxis protein
MLRDIKKDQIETYLKTLQNQLLAISDDNTIIDSMKEMKPAYATYLSEVSNTLPVDYKQKVVNFYKTTFADKYKELNGGDNLDTNFITNSLSDTAYALQYNYVVDNVANMHDNSTYAMLHKKYDPKFKKMAAALGFYDIMLVDDISGNIIYNLSKEIDFAASINGPLLKNSNIAKAFYLAKQANYNDYVTITDFADYLPTYNNPEAFISSPVYDNGTKIGIVICELSIETINNIMTNNKQWHEVGLGETGETILVGDDYKLRSMGRFFYTEPESFLQRMHDIVADPKIIKIMQARKTDLGLQTVDMDAAKEAIMGNKGYNIFYGYRQFPVFAAYDKLNVAGIDWAIIAKIDQSEALAASIILKHKIWLYTAITLPIILFISLLLSYMLATRISRRIEIFSHVLSKISKTQDLTTRVKVTSKDELGHMAYSLNKLLNSLQELVKETLISTKGFYSEADKLRNLADTEKNAASLKSLQETGDNLTAMTARIENLSKKFKFLEDEQSKTDDW